MNTVIKKALLIGVFLVHGIANAGIIELKLDSTTYSLGQKSLLRAYVATKPNNPDDEIVFSSKLNGENQEVLSLDSRLGFGLSNDLTLEGTNEWSVEAFVQNRKLVERYEKIILSYTNENVELAQLISEEVNPDQKAILQEIYDRNTRIISHADLAISEQRRKIGQATVQFEVTTTKNNLFLSPVFQIEMDQEDRIYQVGEFASFTLKLMMDVTGPSGVHEIIMNSEVEAAGSAPALLLLGKKVDDRTFRFTSDIFTSVDVGVRRLIANVKSRPKFQSDAIRDAIKYAKIKEGQISSQISSEEDMLTRNYLTLKKQMLAPFITNLNGHLSEIIEPLLDSQGARFDVVL